MTAINESFSLILNGICKESEYIPHLFVPMFQTRDGWLKYLKTMFGHGGNAFRKLRDSGLGQIQAQEVFQSLYIACWMANPLGKGSFLIHIRDGKDKKKILQYLELLGSRKSTHLKSHGRGRSAVSLRGAGGWFLKGGNELLVQAVGKIGTKKLYGGKIEANTYGTAVKRDARSLRHPFSPNYHEGDDFQMLYLKCEGHRANASILKTEWWAHAWGAVRKKIGLRTKDFSGSAVINDLTKEAGYEELDYRAAEDRHQEKKYKYKWKRRFTLGLMNKKIYSGWTRFARAAVEGKISALTTVNDVVMTAYLQIMNHYEKYDFRLVQSLETVSAGDELIRGRWHRPANNFGKIAKDFMDEIEKSSDLNELKVKINDYKARVMLEKKRSKKPKLDQGMNSDLASYILEASPLLLATLLKLLQEFCEKMTPKLETYIGTRNPTLFGSQFRFTSGEQHLMEFIRAGRDEKKQITEVIRNLTLAGSFIDFDIPVFTNERHMTETHLNKVIAEAIKALEEPVFSQ